MRIQEKKWQYSVPKNLCKDFAKEIHSDNPDFENIRQTLIQIIQFVKDSVGEEDFFEEDLLDDLEWADFETEDDVDYYIDEMYDVLDGYNIWMEPASFFDNDDEEEDFEESCKMKEAREKDYAKKFGEMLKAVGLDKDGPFGDEDVSYDDTGFTFESQAARLHVSFDPKAGYWEVYWVDLNDDEVLADKVGEGFNNLIDYLFSLDTTAFEYADAKASDFYITDSKSLYKHAKEYLKDWSEEKPSNPRILNFVKAVLVACRLGDDETLKKLVYEYSDIEEAVPPLYEELLDYLEAEKF